MGGGFDSVRALPRGNHAASVFRQCYQPDFRLFPRYAYGEYRKKDNTPAKRAGRRQRVTGKEQIMITGAGLGEHTLPLRINNPRELVVLECLPKEV